MATNTELRAQQTSLLFELMRLEKDLQAENAGSGISLSSLRKLILKTEASMTQEDVAWVEKKIAAL